jgi:hypothetical protein
MFFFEKTKKLLSVSATTGVSLSSETPDAMGKSFLLLFFKKEESLPCLPEHLRSYQKIKSLLLTFPAPDDTHRAMSPAPPPRPALACGCG